MGSDSDLDKMRRRFEEVTSSVLATGRIMEMDSYIQHGRTTTLDHTLSVAAKAFSFSHFLHLNVDERALIRGAILHDYYLYDWHDGEQALDRWHGFTHPYHALGNATEDFPDLTDLERDIIVHHMFPFLPLPPRSLEAWLVCLADKACTIDEFLDGLGDGK